MTPAEYRDWNMGLARYWQAHPEHPQARERIAQRVRAARRGHWEYLLDQWTMQWVGGARGYLKKAMALWLRLGFDRHEDIESPHLPRP